jgi:polypeptide N-acetylgalactosaminyltransferase
MAIATISLWIIHKSDLNRLLSGKYIKYEREIEIDLRNQIRGLCDGGVECFLPDEEVEMGDESYRKNGINVKLSDRISYNRTPPYVRHELCKTLHYDIFSLPTASVVIIFYEEPYSVLLRTVHSILNTAPSALLKEIILVDDFSSYDDLRGKLKHYVETRLPKKVRLIRMNRQLISKHFFFNLYKFESCQKILSRFNFIYSRQLFKLC